MVSIYNNNHNSFLMKSLLLISFRSSRNGRKISYQSLHRHKAPLCSTSGWIPIDSEPFQSFQLILVSFGQHTNSSQYWNQTRSTHLVTTPVTWRNASHHISLLFLLLQFFCEFHPLQLSFKFLLWLFSARFNFLLCVFCNIIFSFVSLHLTSLTSIWKGSYNSAF